MRGEEVDFTLYPDWFLCDGHKLANVPWTRDEPMSCGVDRSEIMRNARPVVNWRR